MNNNNDDDDSSSKRAAAKNERNNNDNDNDNSAAEATAAPISAVTEATVATEATAATESTASATVALLIQDLLKQTPNMSAQNLATMQVLQAEVAKMEADNTKLEADNTKLEADKTTLEATKTKLEAEIKYLSYDDMIQRFGGIPDMPRISELVPHVHKGHASFSVDLDFVKDDDLKFHIKSTEKTTGHTLQSFLHSTPLDENPQNPTGPKILSYQNEATVANYVQGVVQMCLKSMGLFEEGRLHKVMSLFSLRPDLMLVMHKTGGIILIIEVKMPGEEVYNSGGVAKQVANYLMLQYRLGNTTPFVLLSSYTEACLCHLTPASVQTAQESEDDVVGEGDVGDKYQTIVEQAAQKLGDGADFTEEMGRREDQEEEQGRPKRPRTARENLPRVDLLSPEVVYSQRFNRSNMMHGVLLAIACGLEALRANHPMKDSDCWPRHNSSIDGLHPQVESGQLQWARVRNMTIDYVNTPLASQGQGGSKKFLLLREIGRGKSGKVFLAVDYEGKACALKFYLMDSSAERAVSPTGRTKERQKQLRETLAAAKAECQLWKDLQEDYIHDLTTLELNGQGVLKMPLFFPLPAEMRGEKSILDTVEGLLHHFFNKKRSVYKEVRWQHIGYRNKGDGKFELALLDMESLKRTKDVRVIATQMSQLFERRHTEPQPSMPTSLLQATSMTATGGFDGDGA